MLLPIVYGCVFVALNIFIWALPLSQEKLFAISLPLGGAYFWGVSKIYRGG